MIEQARSSRIERNGNTVFLAVAGELTCYAESGGPWGTARHRHPAWTLTLSADGPLTATDDSGAPIHAAGILVPPNHFHATTREIAATTVWIDPHHLHIPGAPRIHALDDTQVRRLIATITTDFDPDPLRHALRSTFGTPPPADPRITHALTATEDELRTLPRTLDISPRRLRQLAQAHFHGPLTPLRRWHRLREAGLHLPHRPAAEVAATSGFADQPHLIRTAMALCGRTPASSPAAANYRPPR